MPIYKKGQKEELENYRPVSLTSVLGKVMEKIILSSIAQHMQDNQGTRPSQQGLLKGRSCFISLNFYGKGTCLVDVVYLDFNKVFDTISHCILLKKLAAYGLDGCTVGWVKNWLDAWAQVEVGSAATSSCQPVTSGVPQGTVLSEAGADSSVSHNFIYDPKPSISEKMEVTLLIHVVMQICGHLNGVFTSKFQASQESDFHEHIRQMSFQTKDAGHFLSAYPVLGAVGFLGLLADIGLWILSGSSH
ncbi:hypothetical protein HGM15179_011030 [Zosterops borbonicus]|uniref:Reverse transcriptase domain-containing protein n=1 Tax=Zosterops borbonicus TaxID=364589 RepID=A0A8K1GDH7_9PASS|nr:hypothetical protein HGM15179_011030 [Zosterops borbonicus]